VEAPYKTFTKKFVVCLDTLRQDRKLSAEEIACAEKWVKLYVENWQRGESENLRSDI